MGVTLTDVLLFGKAQSDDVDNATLVIYRRNILRWSALGGYLDIIVHGISPISLPDAIADSLEYLKAFGGTHQGLPSGYDPVNFIYFLDGAYLQTDIVPTYDGKVEMDFTATASPASAYLLGGRNSGAGGGMFFAVNGNKFFLDAFGSASSDRYSSNIAPVSNTRYKFTFNNKVATLESGGTTLFTNTFTGTEANGAKLCINGLNSNGTITGGGQIGIYLYSFKVWDNQGKLIANYVPCAKTNPLTVGLYDLVTDTFINAPTSGTWAAGPAAGASVNPTPDAPIDIVSNNGVLKLSPNLILGDSWILNASRTSATGDTYSLSEAVTTAIFPVESNTTYVACYNGVANKARWYEYGENQTYIAGSYVADSQTLTTSSNTKYIAISFVGTQLINVVTQEKYKLCSVNKGSVALPYVPYGQIYADGTVETINVHGKNLLDINSSGIVAGYLASDGSLVQSTSWSVSDYIPIKANTTFTYSTTRPSGGLGSGAYLAYYDANYAFISTQNQGSNANKTFTTPAGTAYIKVSFFSSGNWQVEQGSTATDYEAYFDGGTAVAEMLLKVGDYEDVQSIIDGVVTRNVGIKVFDGTEAWSAGSAQNPNRFILAGAFNDIAQIPNENVGYANCYTVVARSSNIQSILQNNECGWNTTYVFCVRDDRFDTVAQFTAWLAGQYNAGTPVIIVYPLETPTTESVTGQPMQVQQGDNFVEITQASLDNLEIEAKYQAAVSLTIQEVQDANLDPNVQVTIN